MTRLRIIVIDVAARITSKAMMKLMLAAIVAIGWLALADTASACQCRSNRDLTASQVLADADVLFTGQAVRSVPEKIGRLSSYSITTFRVTEAVKGVKLGQLIKVGHTSGPTSACGLQFEIGKLHTLGPTRWKGGLSISICEALIFRSDRSNDLIGELRTLKRSK